MNGAYDPSAAPHRVPACLTPLPVAFQDSCVSPEGSLSLLKSVRLAPTVQAAAAAADSGRPFPARLETSARRDLGNRCPARQGPTRIYPDRCQSVSTLHGVARVFVREERTSVLKQCCGEGINTDFKYFLLQSRTYECA